jgi:uncharacterized protein YgiB involved in biofilm formation
LELDNFFFIKCKNCIDQKGARQACETSWKPAVHIDIDIQEKGKTKHACGNSLPPSTREEQPKQTNLRL